MSFLSRISGAVIAMLLAGNALATTVKVISVSSGKADVIVNGSMIRNLRTGQVSPEGVKLVSANNQVAMLQIDGKFYTLGLGQGTNPSVVLRADPRGHFLAAAAINGVPIQTMVDTGASFIALNRDDAQRLGIDYRRGVPTKMMTANGAITAYKVNLAIVKVGEIVVSNVEAVVEDGGKELLAEVLLGMSFLNRVEMRRSGDTMTLARRI